MPEHRPFGRFDDESQERGVLELGVLAPDEGGVHVRRHVLHFGIERVIDDVLLQVVERLLGNGSPGLLLRPHVDSRQQMVRGSLDLSIRQEVGLTLGTEIENASEVIVVPEPADILIGGVMQVGSTEQQTRAYMASIRSGDTAEVARVNNMVEEEDDKIENGKNLRVYKIMGRLGGGG